jgi:hypothetical protein
VIRGGRVIARSLAGETATVLAGPDDGGAGAELAEGLPTVGGVLDQLGHQLVR